MLDFGWSELFLIIILGIVLIGPKDIPELVYQAGRLLRRAQYLRFALSKQFDAFMEQNDLQELRRGGGLGDVRGDVRSALTLPKPDLAHDHKVPNVAEDPTDDPDDESSFHHDVVEEQHITPAKAGVQAIRSGSRLSPGLQKGEPQLSLGLQVKDE